MARRRMARILRNPTTLEATLLTVGGVILGGVGGFFLAGWACTKVLRTAVNTGALDPEIVGDDVASTIGSMQ